jgi:hypothetical protein
MPLTRIKSLGITDGTIVNADINASAAIAGTKISGSFGKVLQVVTATDSTERSTTSTTYVTGSNTLSVSITPSSASNKIFIITNFMIGLSNTQNGFYTIYRDSTNLGVANGMMVFASSSSSNEFPTCMSYLDSPSSTSAITYQVYFKAGAAATTAYLVKGSVRASITAFEIAG